MTPRLLAAAAAALLASALALGARAQPDADVPFVVTPDNVTLSMLELAGVGSDDHVIDLGSGDGRIVIAAAQRFGASGLGVEIVPELVHRSRGRAARAGVAERARFIQQDLFLADLTPATVVTMYLLPDVNLRLRPRLLALRPGTRIVSHDWDLGDWAPDRTIVVDAPDKPVGREKRSRLHLWVVPAQVDGLWCGAGGSLRVAQHHQRFDAEWAAGGAGGVFQGRIRGVELESRDGPALRLDGERLRVTHAPWPALRDARFSRAAGPACG